MCEDLGELLGCGTYVTQLRRTSVGSYQAQMITLEQLEALAEEGFDSLDDIMLDLDGAITDRPKVELDADSAYYIKLGQPVQVARAPTDGLVRVYDEEQFIGVGKIQDDGRVAPKRMMNL